MSADNTPKGTTAAAPQPPEQRRYARWLRVGSVVGLLVMGLGFVAYATGLLPATVPPAMLPQWWALPAAEFVRASGAPTGWGWAARVGRGDMAALGGIALLAACPVPGLLALLPLYLRRRERALALLCLGEALVIVLAASVWSAGPR